MASEPYERVYGETDMEAQIHQLEQEAYSSVLRAFKAQANAISWEKESLITELRKQLRLSNEEHRELLGRVNADDVIRRIREWRQSGAHRPGMLGTGQAIHDPLPSPSVSASWKKEKTSSFICLSQEHIEIGCWTLHLIYSSIGSHKNIEHAHVIRLQILKLLVKTKDRIDR